MNRKMELLENFTVQYYAHFQHYFYALLAICACITGLLAKGKITHNSLPFGSRLFCASNTFKLKGVNDYHTLIRFTKLNHILILLMDEMLDRRGNEFIFSKLYLKSGLHEIMACKKTVEKTARKTKYGHVELLVMPMELSNNLAIFQGPMNVFLADCIDRFMVIYLQGFLFIVLINKNKFIKLKWYSRNYLIMNYTSVPQGKYFHAAYKIIDFD